MKRKIFSGLLVAVAFASAIIAGCKKEKQTTTDFLSEAKNWYIQSTKTASTYLESSNSSVKAIKQNIDWNSARAFKLENGSNILGAPINITYGGVPVKGSFILLVSEENGSFKQLVAHSDKNSYFNNTISDSDIQSLYKGAISLSASHKREKGVRNKDKVSLLPPSSGTCIDWYLTTYYYDDYGNILYTTEVYQYTTCDEGGGGTDPVDPEENCQSLQDVISGEAVSINVSSTVGPVGEDGYREVRYKWIPFRNVFGLWKFISTEKSREYKAGNEWWFGTIKNESLESDGSFFAATVEYKVLSSDVIILKNQGGIRHHYHYKGNFVCKGFPVEINDNGTVDSPVWTTAN